MTATLTAPTAELNGTTTSALSLISANVIANQLQTTAEAIVGFAQSRGVFCAPLHNGGEYMMDLNAVDEGFVREFTYSTFAKSLEPQIQQSVDAIASLRGGAVTATPTTETATPTTDTPQETTPTKARSRGWKLPKKGRTIDLTVADLFSRNAPDGNPKFLESMRTKDEAAIAIVGKIAEKHYKNSTRSINSLWKEIENRLNSVGEGTTATDAQPPTETSRPRRGDGKPPRRKKAA